MHYDYHSESWVGGGGLSDEAWDDGARGSPGLGGTPGPGGSWYEECIGSCNVIEEQLIAILCAYSKYIGVIVGQIKTDKEGAIIQII